ncbi:phosphoserine phosphatase SerB [Shewanella profunda]|uniref:phosphoserine phosphatase SerB n=1 Tax=Shewanella profunda TaxID=254793 RepID=UPI00200FD3BD|nr:phosphoserine phosphatase SerB [Shewanella profunda]MCL1088279.1 phosphoserine phosphatase SerB [Shewanella profunda]
MESLNQDALFLWLAASPSPRFEYQGYTFEAYQESETPPLGTLVRIRVIYQEISAQKSLAEWLLTLARTFKLPHVYIASIKRQVALHCVELALPLEPSPELLATFPHAWAELHIFNTELPKLSVPGLLVMDMDSTAIQIECIDELAAMAGVGEQVAAITERAMQGELDFEQSLRQRVAQLKGADASIIATLCKKLPLMPGLEPMLAELKLHHWHLVVASGGFTPFVGHLKQLLNLDAAFANELVIIDGKLAGTVTGKVVDAQFKADVVERCSAQWNIPKGQRVAIGDGANDIPMVKAADFGIAFHAKPKLAAAADAHIRHLDLRVLPYLLQN